ncbi:competence type IV pilus major pilin ComGC [Paenisporosarcina quisquiliarum]|uniref:competence type IV pilus major pilin ComGC n=1 Tax=Paenisporosarcina quisquiliarum TaxID=365346 RepID=UPI003735E100
MKKFRNQFGFTLIEMMVVLLIISVLILIAIPNVTKHSATIDQKGCQAYVKMVQGQVEAYRMELNGVPTVQNLVDTEYLNADQITCPDGSTLSIDSSGVVSSIDVIE